MTVWPLLVRLTHWLVAVCVLFNLFNESGYVHRLAGYVCIGLVLLRVAYGFVSRHTASGFYLPGARDIRMHIGELMTRQVSARVGHNPLGQYAVYAMWLLIAMLALTGWISRTDAYWGEDWPLDAHLILSCLLQGMVALHLLAVIVMSRLLGNNLVQTMLRRK